jgi:hypothetical protein
VSIFNEFCAITYELKCDRLVAFWLRWRYDCLGSVVVYLTTLFALSSGVSTGFAAVVILNAGVFAEASRQLVKYVI